MEIINDRKLVDWIIDSSMLFIVSGEELKDLRILLPLYFNRMIANHNKVTVECLEYNHVAGIEILPGYANEVVLYSVNVQKELPVMKKELDELI